MRNPRTASAMLSTTPGPVGARPAPLWRALALAAVGLLWSGGGARAQDAAGGEHPSVWDTPALGRLQAPGWLRLGGEVRFRMESQSGLGYRPGASDTYLLVRTRLDVDVHPDARMRIFLQGQDARAPGIRSERATGVFRDPFELRQGYLQLSTGAEGKVAIVLGRQLLLFGDQRLIGALDWTNTSRTFDAARLEVRTEWVDADLFSSAVVRNDPARAFDTSDYANGLHGVYALVRTPWEDVTVEPFFLLRTASGIAGEGEGDVHRYSTGFRFVGALGPWESSVTYAEQWGTAGAASIEARAISLSTAYTFPSLRGLRLLAEYNFATGDRDPEDGVVEGFDDLFPTAHLYYGYNDLVGLRNIRNLRVGGRVLLWGNATFAADVHTFRLARKTDHLYNVAGAVTVRAPEGGAADARVGEEVDLSFSVPVTGTVTAAGGVGHMFPGPFLEANSPGEGHTFAHLALAVRF